MMTHFSDLNKYCLWFIKNKKTHPILLLQSNDKFGVRVIQHHHWWKIFYSAALLNQDIT